MSSQNPSSSPSSSSDPSSSTLLLKKSKGLLAEAAMKLKKCPKNDFLRRSQTNEVSSSCDSPDLRSKDEQADEIIEGGEEVEETKTADMGIKLRPSKKGKKYDWPSVIKQNDTENEKVIEKDKDNDDEEEMDMEFDSYVYLGIVLPDFILFAYDIIRATYGQMNLREKRIFDVASFLMVRVFKLLLFGVLLIPGILVPFIQLVVIGSFEKGNLDLNLFENEKTLLSFAKIFMMFMFGCMALKELSNASKNWMYTLIYMKRLAKVSYYVNKVKKDKTDDHIYTGMKISYYLSNIAGLCPGLIQFIVSLFIQNYSTYIIVNCQNTVELISNFAGLYVILEFDNLMIDFLKHSYLDKFLLKYLKYVSKTTESIIHEGGILNNLEKNIKKMFGDDEIKITEKKARKYEMVWVFSTHKIIIWISLILQFVVVAIPFWDSEKEVQVEI